MSDCDSALQSFMPLRYDMCHLVCKAHSKSISAENLFSGLRTRGIYPLTSLVPGTISLEENNVI